MIITMKNPWLLSVMLCLNILACSPSHVEVTSGESGSQVVPAMSAAVVSVNSQLELASSVLIGNEASSGSGVFTPSAVGINSVWQNTSGVSPLEGTGATSLQSWFVDQFNTEYKTSFNSRRSFAGRVEEALHVFCYLGYADLPFKSDNLPQPGVYNITIAPEEATICSGATNDENFSAALTVTDPVDATLYDRLIRIESESTPNCPVLFYARINDDVIRIAQSERHDCSGRGHAQKTVLDYDRLTDELRFYFVSKAFSYPAVFELYRGYLDVNSDESYVVGFYGADDNGDTSFSDGLSFVVAGRPLATGSTAVSVKSIGNTISDNTYQACISPNDMSIDIDNSLMCTLTGTDADLTHTNVVQDLYDDYTTLESLYLIGEATSVKFTDSVDIMN